MTERVIAVVPAYNEEKWIAGVLKPLVEARNRGIIEDILVVDDGSTDKTAEIVHGFGVSVINHPENRGKSEAFFTALHYCRESEVDIMFMTDADMLNLTPEIIERFLSRIRGNEDVKMIRSEYGQERWDPLQKVKGFMCSPDKSGFRALRVDAVVENKPLVAVLNVGRFALERALEEHFRDDEKLEVRGMGLQSRSPGGGATPLDHISADVRMAGDALSHRARTAKNLLLLHRLRRLDPEDHRVRGRGLNELVEEASGLSKREAADIRQLVEGVGGKINAARTLSTGELERGLRNRRREKT